MNPEASSLDRYAREVRAIPRLTHAEVCELARERDRKIAAGGDGRAEINAMVEANLRLALNEARRWWASRGRYGVPMDVVQNANLGLIRGAEKFDGDAGFQFSTYAMWWIKQAIQWHALDDRDIIVPVHAVEAARRAKRMRAAYVATFGEQPEEAALAEASGQTVTTLRATMQVIDPCVRLEAWMRGTDEKSDTRRGELLADLEEEERRRRAAKIRHADQLATRLLGLLEPRERNIMRLRFGLDSGEERSLREVAQRYDLTHERIRQIESKVIEKVRAVFPTLKDLEAVTPGLRGRVTRDGLVPDRGYFGSAA